MTFENLQYILQQSTHQILQKCGPSSYEILKFLPFRFCKVFLWKLSPNTNNWVLKIVEKEEPEVDEEDPLIQALKKSKEKPDRKSPPDLTCSDMITDLSFHPGSNLIAHSDINGKM